MLGKLIKHDFKSTGKILIPLNLILILVTLAGSLLLGTRLLQRPELLPLSIVLLIAYVLVLFTLSTVTVIFLIVNFYRSMFSAQGYLTFTLPTSSWSLLHSKTIVGFVWLLLSTLLTMGSVFLLIGSAVGFGNISSVMQEFFQVESIVSVDNGMSISMSLQDILGYTPVQLVILFLLMTLCSCFFSAAAGYGSVAIGQLYSKHKIVGTVLAYVAVYFVAQIIMSISMFAISFRPIFGMISVSPDAELEMEAVADIMRSIYQPMFPMLIIIYLVLGIICYAAAGIIMKKKVNLD